MTFFDVSVQTQKEYKYGCSEDDDMSLKSRFYRFLTKGLLDFPPENWNFGFFID